MKKSAMLLCVATMIILAACNRIPGPVGVGQTVMYKGFEMTVKDVQIASDLQGARKARAGNNLVAVQVTIVNRGGKSGAHWDPAHSRVIDRATGTQHKAHTTGLEPILTAVSDLTKSQPIEGWVTYEVPASAKSLNFEYELPVSFDHVILKVMLDRN